MRFPKIAAGGISLVLLAVTTQEASACKLRIFGDRHRCAPVCIDPCQTQKLMSTQTTVQAEIQQLQNAVRDLQLRIQNLENPRSTTPKIPQ